MGESIRQTLQRPPSGQAIAVVAESLDLGRELPDQVFRAMRRSSPIAATGRSICSQIVLVAALLKSRLFDFRMATVAIAFICRSCSLSFTSRSSPRRCSRSRGATEKRQGKAAPGGRGERRRVSGGGGPRSCSDDASAALAKQRSYAIRPGPAASAATPAPESRYRDPDLAEEVPTDRLPGRDRWSPSAPG